MLKLLIFLLVMATVIISEVVTNSNGPTTDEVKVSPSRTTPQVTKTSKVTASAFSSGLKDAENVNKTMKVTNVIFDGNLTSHGLNWTHIFQRLSAATIMEMWLAAGITQNMTNTYSKFKDIYKFKPLINSTVSRRKYTCVSDNVLSTMAPEQVVSGYRGDFGIDSRTLLNEILVKKIVRKRGMYDMFFDFEISGVEWNFNLGVNDIRSNAYFTRDYAALALNSTANDQIYFNVLIGKPEKFPNVKGYVSYPLVEVVKNDEFALAVISTWEAFGNWTGLFTIDFNNIFETLIGNDLDDTIEHLQGSVLGLEISGACRGPRLDPHMASTLIKILGVHFLLTHELSQSTVVHMGCLTKHLVGLDLLNKLLQKCLQVNETLTLHHESVNQIASRLAKNIPFESLDSLSTEDQSIAFDMMRLGKDNFTITNETTSSIEKIIDKMYTRYSYSYDLPTNDRRQLMNMYLAFNTIDHEARLESDANLLKTYVLASSMCTSLELGNLIEKFSNHDISIVDTFSPCYLSLRYDFDRKKLVQEAPQSSKLKTYDVDAVVGGFLHVLHDNHKTNVNQLPSINCTSNTRNILLVIPLKSITYIISPNQIEGAQAYDVTEIFLKNSMVISAVHKDCSPFKSSGELHKIPIVYNISQPRFGCPFCDSVILSYDETQGFQSMMYVTNKKVQSNLFLDTSPFFDYHNLHIHYLWLQNNGSVIEIRGTYRRQISGMIGLFLIFLSFSISIYLGYKIITLMF
ncbi:glycoprotein H [Saguinine gammaherpesvirus 1]|uniref:Glycoprotein H n=1 Tax=Saguinine gammaherpesvirus 1 TaxID=2169901 RepID=A0A9Q8QTB9_9GAMA|nr:glycoprotein H [Saguinine gammaherpesvirus 1]